MPLTFARPALFDSLKGYETAWLRGDVSAGLAIAAVGLPSAIAYPAIAGLPVETGLYASIIPMAAYALLGPSRQLIIGPDAATMTVIAAVLASILAAPGVALDRVEAVALLALCVGVLCLIARIMQLGVLATFLSRPILVGFFAGISLSLLIGQLGRMTGVDIQSNGILRPLLELISKAGSIHWLSVLVAVIAYAVLQMTQFMRWPVPGPVVVVLLSIPLSAALGLQERGVATVGEISMGVPALHIPPLAGVPLEPLLLGATAIFLVSFGSGIITARSFADRVGQHVDPNRELVGFGAANIAAGLFSTFPITASDSRTAVNMSVGGRTQIASLTAAATLLVVVLFFGGILRFLPIPALGAIIAATAFGLIDVAGMKQIWRISKVEFVFALIALCGPIGLGVLNGVVIAIVATLLYLLRQMANPHDAILGRIEGHEGFYKLHRRPEARAVPGFAACMVQDSVLFFNTDNVLTRLRAIADGLPKDTRWMVIDASAIPQVDSSAATMFNTLQADLKQRGIVLAFAELHTEVWALLERAGVIRENGGPLVFDSIDDAYRAFAKETAGTKT